MYYEVILMWGCHLELRAPEIEIQGEATSQIDRCQNLRRGWMYVKKDVINLFTEVEKVRQPIQCAEALELYGSSVLLHFSQAVSDVALLKDLLENSV